MTKAIQPFVQGLIPGNPIWVRKATGTLLVDKRPLATVIITSEDDARLSWNDTKSIQYKIEQKVVNDQFEKLVAERKSSS